jgi:hypothetical protein
MPERELLSADFVNGTRKRVAGGLASPKRKGSKHFSWKLKVEG